MNPYEAQQLAMRIGFMKEPEFKAFAEEHKHDIQIFPLIYEEDKRRKSLERNQQMQQAQQGAVPPVNEQVLAKMQAPETSPMPEDVGIAQLPTGDMQFANGGIVAFADGGKAGERARYEELVRAEAKRLGVDPEHMLRLVQAESAFNPNAVSTAGAAGLMQLMPGTAKDMGLADQDRFVPEKSIRGGTGYFKQLLDRFGGDYEKATAAYNWGPNREAFKKDDWKLGLPKETAKYLTRVMPMGAAQAAPATTSAPEAPALAPEADGGLSTLFQRIMPIRGAPSRELPPLDFGKMATTIGKNLGVARGAGSPQAATTATVPAAPVVATPDFADSQGSIENARSTMPPKPPAAPKPDLSAAEEKKVVAAAKQAAPDDVDTSGFTREDWLTLGFSLLSSKSPRFVEALGESGLKMVAGRQARMKMGQEERKIKADIAQSEAQTRNYDALARRYANEDKPMAQYLKAVDAAIAKLTALDNFTYHDAKPQEQRRMEQAARDRVLDTYRNAYPELEDTILGKSGRELVDKYLKPQ